VALPEGSSIGRRSSFVSRCVGRQYYTDLIILLFATLEEKEEEDFA